MDLFNHTIDHPRKYYFEVGRQIRVHSGSSRLLYPPFAVILVVVVIHNECVSKDMKSKDIMPEEVRSILSHIKDQELRDGLAEVFHSELLGSRSHRVSDVGRLRR